MSKWGDRGFEKNRPMSFGQRVRLAEWAEGTAHAVAAHDPKGLGGYKVLAEVLRVLRGEGDDNTDE